MNLPGRAFCIGLLAILGLCLGNAKVVRAQDGPPDEFIIRYESGQRRLNGVIKSINPERGSFVLAASSFTYPSGQLNPLEVPVPMLVLTTRRTYFHLRGDKDMEVSYENLHVGDSAVIIGIFSPNDQSWSAVEIALWTRKQRGHFMLDGVTRAPNNLTGHSSVSTPMGLITTWSGAKSGVDASGNHSGVQHNGTTYEAGLIGSAFSFDGQDDRLVIPDAPDFALTQSLSCEGWLFIKSSDKDAVLFMRGDNQDGIAPYALLVRNNGILRFHVASETQSVDIDAELPIGVWTHVATTLDNETGKMRIFVDGQVASETKTDVRPAHDLTGDSQAGLGLGNTSALPDTTHNAPFHGLIDEWSIYNRALTPQDVQSIYGAGDSGKVPIDPSKLAKVAPVMPVATEPATAPVATPKPVIKPKPVVKPKPKAVTPAPKLVPKAPVKAKPRRKRR